MTFGDDDALKGIRQATRKPTECPYSQHHLRLQANTPEYIGSANCDVKASHVRLPEFVL